MMGREGKEGSDAREKGERRRTKEMAVMVAMVVLATETVCERVRERGGKVNLLFFIFCESLEGP